MWSHPPPALAAHLVPRRIQFECSDLTKESPFLICSRLPSGRLTVKVAPALPWTVCLNGASVQLHQAHDSPARDRDHHRTAYWYYLLAGSARTLGRTRTNPFAGINHLTRTQAPPF